MQSVARLIFALLVASQAWGAYSFSRQFTITSSSTLLPATQANFPVLVSLNATNAGTTMKSVANGGHIQNAACTQASGPAVTMPCDLIFASDAAGANKIAWEVESYDSTNGVLLAHVGIASLSLSQTFYVIYGDATVTTPQNTGSFSPANVWNSSFGLVQHLSTASPFSVVDSTVNANTCSLVNSPTAGTGQIDGAATFASASIQSVTCPTSASLQTTTGWTYSVWVKLTSLPAAYASIVTKDNAAPATAPNAGAAQLLVKSTGKLAMYVKVGSASTFVSYDGTGTNTLSTGTWYHIAMTYDSTSGLVGYVNGASDGTGAANGNLQANSTNPVTIGISPVNAGRELNGLVDEVRISNAIARSANWIKAEYNAGLAPQTFAAAGAEGPVVSATARHRINIR